MNVKTVLLVTLMKCGACGASAQKVISQLQIILKRFPCLEYNHLKIDC